MDIELYVKITDGNYIYGEYLIGETLVKDTNNYSNRKGKHKNIELDSAFVHYFIQEIKLCNFYRICLVNHWLRPFKLILQETQYDLIDYRWNEKVYYMVRERCELDHALSWLSTLGGAFSALGDYFLNCAETAGRISYHQLKLALKLGDPNIASRCYLYFSLSLIQHKRFKLAQKIIFNEYSNANKALIRDFKLLNMCKGIWAKLQYEHQIFQNQKNKKPK